MPFDNVYLISGELDVATDGAIAGAEAALGTHFPIDYRDYVTMLGAGYLNGQARVMPPDEIVGQTTELRDRLQFLYGDVEEGYDPFSLFEAGLDLLLPERLLACILLVDAGNGHEIVYHPDTPGEIFLLPHDHDRIYKIGRTLEEALAWFLDDDVYVHKTRALVRNGQLVESPVRYFEPDHAKERTETIGFVLTDTMTYADIRTHLVGIALQRPHDALLVGESFVLDEGAEVERLYLFLGECGGTVRTDNEPSDDTGAAVEISYGRGRRTESIEQLIMFYRSHSHTQLRVDSDGNWTSV